MRARRLVLLRAFPSVAGAGVTFGLAVPAYLAFEPPHAYERVGLALPLLALAGAWLLGSSLWTAARTAWATARLERTWLRAAVPLVTEPALGVPAYVMDSPAPIVALVGVFAPRLIAARAVVQACSRQRARVHRGARARAPARARQPQAMADGVRARSPQVDAGPGGNRRRLARRR